MPKRRSPDPVVGTRFANWEVVGPSPAGTSGNARKLPCRCDCGNEHSMRLGDLKVAATRDQEHCRSCRPSTPVATPDPAPPKGSIFGAWTVIRETDRQFSKTQPYGRRMILCLCKLCGKESPVQLQHLKTGASTRCIDCHKTHGEHGTAIYGVWLGIRKRAYNRNGRNPSYSTVGIDPDWDASFEAFMKNPPAGTYEPGKDLSRPYDEGDYRPGNCEWKWREDNQTEKAEREARYWTSDGQIGVRVAITNGVTRSQFYEALIAGQTVDEAAGLM